MYEKLIERSSIDDNDHHLFQGRENDSRAKQPGATYLQRTFRCITFERCIIFALLAALSLSLYRNVSDNQCDARLVADKMDLRPFGRDVDYMTLNHSNDHLWEDLVPWGMPRGTVWSAQGNSDGLETPGAVTMFHQLHCLSSFRSAIQNAAEGKDVGVDWHDNGHWPHCFDYLRNTFLCLADGRIERPIEEDGTESSFIDGQWDERECRRSAELYDLLREKSYNGGDDDSA